jgi:hypothetical protein
MIATAVKVIRAVRETEAVFGQRGPVNNAVVAVLAGISGIVLKG